MGVRELLLRVNPLPHLLCITLEKILRIGFTFSFKMRNALFISSLRGDLGTFLVCISGGSVVGTVWILLACSPLRFPIFIYIYFS